MGFLADIGGLACRLFVFVFGLRLVCFEGKSFWGRAKKLPATNGGRPSDLPTVWRAINHAIGHWSCVEIGWFLFQDSALSEAGLVLGFHNVIASISDVQVLVCVCGSMVSLFWPFYTVSL